MLTFGSLFAGIGGFDLGFERAGLRCKWQVEIDPFCRKVLAKHWPDVRRHDDVKTFPPKEDCPDEWRVDVICGGFPCQDISRAGKRYGIEGKRSGLWSEFARIVRVVRPRIIVVENVADVLDRGFGRVVGDLAACGYDGEWDCLPTAAFGAPHLRDRTYVLGYANGQCGEGVFGGRYEGSSRLEIRPGETWGAWAVEPVLGRVAYGVSGRVDRLRGLGNAVVPQVAEWIGRRLMQHHAQGSHP